MKALKSGSTLSRRELGGAIVAAGVLATASTAAPVKSEFRQSWDVIIVGGGIAGLVAARELRHRGRSVLVIEARDRLGGRTHSEAHGDHVVEYGGTWVHWTQPNVWAEIQRYGLSLDETVGASPARIILATANGPQDLPLASTAKALETALNALLAEADVVFPRPYEPFFARAEVERRDALSVADRLREIDLTAEQRALISAYYATLGHCHLGEMAYLEALRSWALVGQNYRSLSDALARFKFQAGTGALVEAIRHDGRPEILLNTQVLGVAQGASSAKVTTSDGQTLRAKAVIVTVPLNVLDEISFSPTLAPQKRQHARQRHSGHGVKGYATLRADYGVLQGFAADPAPITNIMSDRSSPQGGRLVFFGPDAAKLDITSRESVQAAIRAFLPDADVVEVTAHDWNSDQFSRGTWCHYRPRQLTSFFPANRTPETRVHFASADTATGWRGFIDGAIERGASVGLEVAEALRKVA